MTILADIQSGDPLSDVLNMLRLRGRIFCQSEMSAPWSVAFPPGAFAHFHVVQQGRCWIRVGGQDAASPLSSGDFVMVPHGRGHQISDAPDRPPVALAELLDDPDGGLRAILRHGGGGDEARLICGSFEFESAERHALLSLLPDLIHIPGEHAGNWLELTLTFLASEVQWPRPGAETVVSRLTDLLFIQAIRAWIGGQPAKSGGWLGALRDREISKALGLMHKAPAHRWTVAALAGEVGMSRSPFAARFASLVGEAPLAYLIRWRLRLAADLLRNEKLTVEQIAERVGYESAAALSRAFTRQFGVSPRAFRGHERTGR